MKMVSVKGLNIEIMLSTAMGGGLIPPSFLPSPSRSNSEHRMELLCLFYSISMMKKEKTLFIQVHSGKPTWLIWTRLLGEGNIKVFCKMKRCRKTLWTTLFNKSISRSAL